MPNKRKHPRSCFNCGSEDYFAKHCPNKQPKEREPIGRICYNYQARGHYVSECQKSKKRRIENTYSKKIAKLSTTNDESLMMSISVDNCPVRVFVDLGSDCSIVKKKHCI